MIIHRPTRMHAIAIGALLIAASVAAAIGSMGAVAANVDQTFPDKA